ncbi:alpha/beta hydrolase [Aspergillus ibericus CBS 121593]|uniref:Alpha/beta-hydrolase n=1 Tax=Aspergillus ibericus CBS 121593 TaxID=1448316 RepID=A0A395H010_9EURO|nr:alpha/beta-hydrolase [Aspergillus ibericus CBS 121593]RAL00933.1 alpha/beta-hydrolase [Aspergillus ibericus CBS 121593]
MASSKPTIVLVQGSFQTPPVYAKLFTGLRDAGYPVIHPPLPSCSDVHSDDLTSRTLTDDALVITKAITQLVEEEKYVVVAMHSYGGIVGSEAIPESLTRTARQARGQKGGVIHLFYYAAMALKKGQSILGALGQSPNNDIQPDGRSWIKNGARTLYNDLPAEEAALWESRLIPQSHLVQTTCVTRAAYEYLPSTYLVCENDQVLAPQHQEMFAALVQAEVVRCSAGHSPMLSQPAMLVERIAAVADRVSAV